MLQSFALRENPFAFSAYISLTDRVAKVRIYWTNLYKIWFTESLGQDFTQFTNSVLYTRNISKFLRKQQLNC